MNTGHQKTKQGNRRSLIAKVNVNTKEHKATFDNPQKERVERPFTRPGQPVMREELKELRRRHPEGWYLPGLPENKTGDPLKRHLNRKEFRSVIFGRRNPNNRPLNDARVKLRSKQFGAVLPVRMQSKPGILKKVGIAVKVLLGLMPSKKK